MRFSKGVWGSKLNACCKTLKRFSRTPEAVITDLAPRSLSSGTIEGNKHFPHHGPPNPLTTYISDWEGNCARKEWDR